MFSSLFRQRVYDCGINVNWFRVELTHIFEQLICCLCVKHMTVISALNSTHITIIIIVSGVGLSPLGTAATFGLLYKPQMIDEGDCGGYVVPADKSHDS
jgi:hypothetical protein